jgi:RNA polymerase sigma factor (sigma-70 family)
MKSIIKAYQKDPSNDALWAEIQAKYEPLIYRKASSFRYSNFHDDLVQAGLLGLHQAVLEYNREDLSPMTWIHQHVFGKITKEIYKQTNFNYYYKFKPLFVEISGFDKAYDVNDFDGTYGVSQRDKKKMKVIEQDLDFLEYDQLRDLVYSKLKDKEKTIFDCLEKGLDVKDAIDNYGYSAPAFYKAKKSLNVRIKKILHKLDK